MATARMKRPSQRPEHQVSGRHYPGEWARQIELFLDKVPRRVVLYGGLFVVFVLVVVISLVFGVTL